MRAFYPMICVSLWSLGVAYGSEKPPETPNRPPAKAGEEAPHGEAPKDMFVAMKPLDVPIIQEGKLMGYIGLTATIEGASPEGAQKLKDMSDKIRDRMVQDLWAAYAILWRPGFMPDEEMLKKRIEMSVNAMAGEDDIAGIYIKDFYFRPNPAYQHTSY